MACTLTDFKTGKQFSPPSGEASDLQLGLYQIALEQHYGALRTLSLSHLRSGQRVIYPCTPLQRQMVLQRIGQRALQIRSEQEWQVEVNGQCGTCSYRCFCPSVGGGEELPPLQPRRLQLTLPL
jgi:CRISPR/Cas system-associated exonuclease Cas4 (RecB family)